MKETAYKITKVQYQGHGYLNFLNKLNYSQVSLPTVSNFSRFPNDTQIIKKNNLN